MRNTPESQPSGESRPWLDLVQYEEGFVAGMHSAKSLVESGEPKRNLAQVDFLDGLLREGQYHDCVTVLLLASRELSQQKPLPEIVHAGHRALDRVMDLAPPGMTPDRLEFSLYSAVVKHLQLVKSEHAAIVYAERLRLAMYYSWVTRSLKALFDGTGAHIIDVQHGLPTVFSRAVSVMPTSGLAGPVTMSVCPREAYSKVNPQRGSGANTTDVPLQTILLVTDTAIQDVSHSAWNVRRIQPNQPPQFFVAKTATGNTFIAPISPLQSQAPSLHPMRQAQTQSAPRQRLANNILAACSQPR